MKISIIVPVYGVEKYLDKCIESLVNQTYSNLEIILVDDGGKDNCPKMCDEWAEKDKRIKVIHKENGGQGTARNMALDVMTGNYVLFVDSDDYILPNMVEKLVIATNNGEYDASLCQYKVDNGISLKNVSFYDEERILSTEEAIYAYAVDRTIFTGPVCKLFRASVLEDIRFPSFRANEDAYIMHRLLGKCNKVSLITDYLYVVILRPNSTEGQAFNKNRLHLIDCENDLREYIGANYPQYKEKIQYRLAENILYLIKDIYHSKCEKEHKEIELELKAKLIEEQKELNNSNCKPSLLQEIDCYLSNHSRFVRRVRKEILIKKIKGYIKKLLHKTK